MYIWTMKISEIVPVYALTYVYTLLLMNVHVRNILSHALIIHLTMHFSITKV